MPTSTPIPSNLDQLNFDQLAQMINERDPELYYQRADEFDRATAGLRQLIDGLRGTMRRLEVGLSGLSMDQAAQAAEHLAAKNEAVLQAMQQPGYAAMLRRAADSLASSQQRLRDLQQQRAEQSDAPPEEAGKADEDRTEQARQILRDLATSYGDAAGGFTPLPGTGPGSTPVDQITAEGAEGGQSGSGGQYSSAVYYGPDGTPQVMDAGYAPGSGEGGGAVGTMARTYGNPAGIGGGSGDGSTADGGTGGFGGGDGAGERSGNAAPWLAASAKGAPAVLGQSPAGIGGGGSTTPGGGGWRMASAARSGSVQEGSPQVLGKRMAANSATGGTDSAAQKKEKRPQTSSRENTSSGQEEISTMSSPVEEHKESTADAPFVQSHAPGHLTATATASAAAGATAAGTLSSNAPGSHAPGHVQAGAPDPSGANPPGGGNQPGQHAPVSKSATAGALDAGSSGAHSTTSGGPRSTPSSALDLGQVRTPGGTPTLPRPGGEFSGALPGTGGGMPGGTGQPTGPMHGPMGMMGGAGAGQDRSQQERQPNVPVPADRDSWDDGNGVLGAVGRRSRSEEDGPEPKEKPVGDANAQIDEIINGLREERKIR